MSRDDWIFDRIIRAAGHLVAAPLCMVLVLAMLAGMLLEFATALFIGDPIAAFNGRRRGQLPSHAVLDRVQ